MADLKARLMALLADEEEEIQPNISFEKPLADVTNVADIFGNRRADRILARIRL